MRLDPERRQRLRIVTLKNTAWVAGVLIVLFLAFTVWNEVRSRDALQERLSQRNVALPRVERAPAEAPAEPPVTDETYALRHNARRLTEAPPALPAPPPPTATAPVAAERERPLTLKEARERGERVVITGGAEGVRADATRERPKTEVVVPPPKPL